MTTPSASAAPVSASVVSPGVRRLYAISIGLSALFVLVQYLTAGEFITGGVPHSARETWTDVHGITAYPVMVFALIAAIVAFARLRSARLLAPMTAVYLVLTVIQWLLGHAITTLGIDALTPLHVVVAGLVLALVVWLSVRSALLRRASETGFRAA